MHGGSIPAVREAAAARVLTARVQGELQQRGWEPITDPLGAYADLAGEVWAFKELCRERLADIERWDYSDAKLVQDLKPLVVVYERALDRASRQLHDMLRLGLDHQALRQAKERPSREMAEGFNRILDHVLTGLDLTEDQRRQIPELLAEAVKKEQA